MPMTLDGTSGMVAPVGAVYNGLIQMTAQNTSSGTSFDFTGIPLWVRRVTIIFNGVSTTNTGGSSQKLVQLGSGTITSSGYISSSVQINDSSGTTGTSSTSGFVVRTNGANEIFSGHMVITNISGNIWVASHYGKLSGNGSVLGGGDVTLAGALDRVRVTTAGGDTFDAGSVNVIYE